MVQIKPFRGTRYNAQLIEDPRQVVAPPYDIISPEQQEYYYSLHPNNIIRLILGKETPADDEYNNKYTRATSYFNSWKRDGILVDDMKRSIYVYEQIFTSPDGKKHSRMGFFSLVKLEPYKSKKIFPHENTRSKPKADRLKLLRSTKSNLCPIFVLYSDPGQEMNKLYDEVLSTKPWQEFKDNEGIQHRLWVLNKKSVIEQIHSFMQDKELIIADGHHRYETALNYQREMREVTGKLDGEQPFDFVMTYMSAIDSEGLVILPTHRILKPELSEDVDIKEVMEELALYFDIKEKKSRFNNPKKLSQSINETLQKMGAKGTSFAMLLPPNRVIYLSLKKDANINEIIEDDDISQDLKQLDVVILHRFIISQVWIGNPEVDIEDDDVIYTYNIEEVIKEVNSRQAVAGFVLCPPQLDKIKKIVLNGELMPPKTTFFYPKIISGLVLRDMSLG